MRATVKSLFFACAGVLAAVSGAHAATNVYVSTGGLGPSGIWQFDAGADGALVAKAPQSVSAGTFLTGLALGPAARALYAADNTGSGRVWQFDVAAGGALSSKTPAAVAASNGTLRVAVSPDGRSMYASNSSGFPAHISQYDIGADGSLKFKSPPSLTVLGSPSGIAVSPDGRSVYVTDDSTTGRVLQFDVGAGGALSPKATPSVDAEANPAGIATSPDGRSVYVADRGSNTVSQFDVGAGGMLSPKAPAAFPTGASPLGVAVSPDGRSLYVTNNQAATVSQFAIGTGGRVSPLAPPTVAAGSNPIGVAVSADGRSVYVTDFASAAVSQYSVNSSGALTPKSAATVPVGQGPWGIAVRPDIGPRAALAVARAAAGSPTRLRASASRDPDGTIQRYDWRFGDGSQATTGAALVKHIYARPGKYKATVTVTDDAGCSTALVFTGQTALCSGSPAAQASMTFAIVLAAVPRITALRMVPPLVGPHRARVSYLLNRPARVVFTVRKVTARGVVALPGRISRTGRVGANRFTFTGNVGGTRLRAGRYRLIAIARTGRRTSRPAQLTFRVR